jgi:hypothetical protein
MELASANEQADALQTAQLAAKVRIIAEKMLATDIELFEAGALFGLLRIAKLLHVLVLFLQTFLSKVH